MKKGVLVFSLLGVGLILSANIVAAQPAASAPQIDLGTAFMLPLFFLLFFLIGFWLSGRFARKIKSKILSVLARIVLGFLFAFIVIFVIILIKGH